mgnify:CR=1 FL=1
MEIDSVLVEGGGILNESLIKNDCVHKFTPILLQNYLEEKRPKHL